MKIGRERPKLDGETVKRLFQWDVIKSALAAAFKKETWQRLFSLDLLDEFFGRDLISALHLLGALVILTICIVCYRSGTEGGKVLTLGLFSYFNVFVGIVVVRNSEKFDMSKAIWGLLGMWVMAVGVGLILSSAWEGFSQFIGTCAFVGVFALPVMMLDPNFWKQIFQAILGAIDRAFSGNSIEDIGIGLIGGLLGLVLGAVLILLSGALIVASNYAGLAIGFCRITGCRFARKDDVPTMAEGVEAEDITLPESSPEEVPQANPAEEAHQAEESDEFTIE